MAKFKFKFRHLFSLANRNVFEELLQEMVRLKFFPYTSIEDLMYKRTNRKSYLYMYGIILLLVLNIIRLFLMVVCTTPSMQSLLTAYFYGLNGNREWILVITNFLLTSAILQYSLYWIESKPKIYYGFDLLSYFSAVTSQQDKPANFARFQKVATIHWTINLWFRLSLFGFLIVASIYEPLRGFWGHIDFYFVVRFIIFFFLFNINVYYGESLGVIWLELWFMVIYYHNLQYIHFYQKFNSLVERWASCARRNPVDERLLRTLEKFHQINQSIWRFSAESSAMVAIFYYTILLSVDASLLVIIDPRTHSIIRSVASYCCAFVFSVVFALIILFTTVSYYAGRVMAPVERCLARVHTRPSTRLKLLELRAQLADQMSSISCHGIFTFTVQKSSMIAINFIINFFLVVKLFRNYFF